MHLVHSDVCRHMDVPQVQVPPLDVNVDLLSCSQRSVVLLLRLEKTSFPCEDIIGRSIGLMQSDQRNESGQRTPQ